jgi:hypothetical protein
LGQPAETSWTETQSGDFEIRETRPVFGPIPDDD